MTIFLSSCGEECSNTTDPNAEPPVSNVRIGVILPLTGELDIYGKAVKAGFELAASDISAELALNGSNIKLNYVIKDDESMPAKSLSFLQEMHENDSVNIFFGMVGSNQIAAVSNYVNANNCFVLSPSSTSSAYAVDDNIFRYVPSDDALSQACTKVIVEDSIKCLISINNANVACKTLVQKLNTNLANAGVAITTPIEYTSETTYFTTTVSALRTQLVESLKSYQSNEIGVYLSSFGEYIKILELLDEKLFKTIHWYGSDGTYSTELFASEKAATFATTVGFISPALTNDENTQAKYEQINQRIKAKIGVTGEPYGATAYDAAINMLTTAANCRYANISVFKSQFITTSQRSLGATGRTELNSVGDRKFGCYNFDTPEKIDGVWQYVTKIYIAN